MLVYEVFAFLAESHMIFPFDLFNHKALLPLNYHSLTCIAPVKEARYLSHLFNSRFLERKKETKALLYHFFILPRLVSTCKIKSWHTGEVYLQ